MEQKRLITGVLAVAAALSIAAPALALINGIDISAYQGDITASEWQQIKGAGIQFVFARVSLGACCDRDANYVNNFSRAIAAGIPIGPYAVGYPHTNMSDPNDAANEANYLISLVKPYYQGSGLMLRPVLDIELPTDLSLSKTFVSQWVVKWATTIKEGLGVDPIIYTYTAYAASELNSTVTPYPLWIANYNYAPPSARHLTSAYCGSTTNSRIPEKWAALPAITSRCQTAWKCRTRRSFNQNTRPSV